ncbi:hypothetical protein EVAR_95915_1 [Eumeta japonica]|uniref:Uncharacterized protein n=1 Tax=Eumeta variegata TaxID=151549 RepID=A0A4C1XIN0_EUMVA|nr:hypothetical protein EVAR_95915_1 [Eumeta japonica]
MRAHRIDVFVIHSSRRVTIMKFITEINKNVLEFCKPIINRRLSWCFIAKSSSKLSEAFKGCGKCSGRQSECGRKGVGRRAHPDRVLLAAHRTPATRCRSRSTAGAATDCTRMRRGVTVSVLALALAVCAAARRPPDPDFEFADVDQVPIY